MTYEVKQVGSVIGKENEVIKLSSDYQKINIKTNDDQLFAVVICMSCESHQNRIRRTLIVPNVTSHEDAHKKAKSQWKLNGKWATEVGISLFKANADFEIPNDWEKCDKQFNS
jgi:hypothetical protein